MKRRVRIGLAGMMVTGLYSLVGTTAFALFMAQAQLNQMSFKTARRELFVSAEQVANPIVFASTVQFPGSTVMYPGMPVAKEDFWVWNNSTAGQMLTLTGKFEPGNQQWDALKDVVEVNLMRTTTGTQTGWKTLAQWQQSPVTFPDNTIEDGTKQRYQLQYRLPTNYLSDPDGAGPLQAGSPIGNELMDKVTAGASFVIDGNKL